MDRRQYKTRDAIFRAFNQLLEEKSFNNITVQEIIDKANIGRSTFYSHFETKDELLKALCTDIFLHVFSEELMKEKTHDFSNQTGGLEKKITHILYHLQDSRREIKGLLSCESGELFMKFFKEYLSEVFSGDTKSIEGGIPEEYRLNHMVCSFAETVRWWLCDKPKYSPEEITGFYFLVTGIGPERK